MNFIGQTKIFTISKSNIQNFDNIHGYFLFKLDNYSYSNSILLKSYFKFLLYFKIRLS